MRLHHEALREKISKLWEKGGKKVQIGINQFFLKTHHENSGASLEVESYRFRSKRNEFYEVVSFYHDLKGKLCALLIVDIFFSFQIK